MATPYIGEIRMFAGNFPINGWAFCHGQLLPIADNDALFQLIGTTYGGDGQTTFALPDLRGRVPVHMGTGPGLSTRVLGQVGGQETVTLTTNQIPSHGHAPTASTQRGTQTSPANGVWAGSATAALYSSATPGVAMNPAAVGVAGGSQPHENRIPFLAVNFIISLYGIFPSQN